MSEEIKYIGSTKKEIYDAYKELLETKTTAPQSTTAVKEAQKIKDATSVADSYDIDDTILLVNAIKTDTERLDKTYENLSIAVEAKKQELKEVHGLEVQANSVAALSIAKDKILSEKNEQAEEIIEAAQVEAQEIIQKAEIRGNEVKQAISRYQEETSRSRKRDEEQYNYEFNRRRQADLDALNDEKASIEKAIVVKQDELLERENKIIEQENDFTELVVQVDQLKTQLVADVAAAKEAGKAQAFGIAKKDKETQEQIHKAEKSILEAKVSTLQGQVEDLTDRLDDQQERVEDANQRVSDMAQGAFKAQGNAATVEKIAELMATTPKK
jgi:hypothetical protein